MTLSRENRLQAAVIRKRRLELKWKQEAFAATLPVSLSYYSEMERGLCPIPEDLLPLIRKQLRLPQPNSHWIEEIQTRLELIRHKLYSCAFEQAGLLMEKVLAEKNRIDHSVLFLDFELTRLIWSVSCAPREEKKRIALIERYADCLSEEQRYVFQLYQGILYKALHQPEKAEKQFQTLLNGHCHFRYYTELLYYHAAIAEIQKGSYVTAMIYNQRAEQAFTAEANLYRLAYTLMHEAIIYTHEHQYAKAEQLYCRLLEQCGSALPDKVFNSLIGNAGYSCLQAGHYSKALNHYRNLKAGWEVFPELFFGIAWSLLQTDATEELHRFLDRYRTVPKNKFIDDVLEIIEMQSRPGQEKRMESKLKRCERYLLSEGSEESIVFVYEQLIRYYESRSVVRQNRYLKKLAGLKQRGYHYGER